VVYIGLARIEVLPDMREDFTPNRYAGDLYGDDGTRRGHRRDLGVFEYSSDSVFGSNLQLSNRDTVGDLIADTLGSAAGGILLVAWTKYGWGSVRRIPGESRYEDTRA
jgi:hypothetical protein